MIVVNGNVEGLLAMAADLASDEAANTRRGAGPFGRGPRRGADGTRACLAQ